MADTDSGLPVCSATVIQDLIDRTAGTGYAAYVPPGIYLADNAVYLSSDVTLVFDAAAILRRNYASTAAEGMLTQRDMSSKIVNVKLSGGRLDNPQPYDGTSIAIFGDNISISGMEVLDFYGGLGVVIVGDDNKLSDLRVVTSSQVTGAGGIRMAGGHNFLCSNCYVESGDDALQFVPISPNNGAAIENISIADSQYVNCIGISAAARACVVFLENRSSTYEMTANVTNCAFIGIRGQGGPIGALCANKALDNQPSTGLISNIQFIGVSLSLGDATTGANFQVQRDSTNGGPIQQIDFIGCTGFLGAGAANSTGAAGLYVQEASQVRWIGGSIAASAVAQYAVQILSSSDCAVADTEVVCGEQCQAGIYVGYGDGSTEASDRVAISNVTVRAIPDTTGYESGISLDRTDACTVTSSTLISVNAMGGSTGILVNDSKNCRLDQNNCLLVGQPYVFSGESFGFINGSLGAGTSATGTIGLSSGTADVTFPFARFVNDRYSVQLTGNTTAETFAFSNRTETGFTITSSNPDSTAEVCWSALITQFTTP